MKELQDQDPMPFGKYEGQLMEDVPASYLHWLWMNGKQYDINCPVSNYIKRNMDALKMEHPDGLWGH